MRTTWLLPALVAAVLLCAGCSGDRKPVPGASGTEAGMQSVAGQGQTGAGPAGGAELRIEPETVYRGTKVHISSATRAPSGATVEWLVNGRVVQSGESAMLDTAQSKKGDTIQARATAGSNASLSQIVTVRNSPPEVKGIRFMPGDGQQGSPLGVEVEGFDADGDAFRIDISWRKNGMPAGAGNRFAGPVKRGDKLDVTVTPFDEEGPGKSATLFREIRNTPPTIEGHEQFQVGDNVVTFRIRASDPDGDAIAFSLKDAPAGMRIDRGTGWVRWETAAGATGKVPFTVSASDGAGGEANARITVTVTAQPSPGVRR